MSDLTTPMEVTCVHDDGSEHPIHRRADSLFHLCDRELLRLAAARTIWADDTTDSPHHAATDLRIAEAALRTLWRRHQDTP